MDNAVKYRKPGEALDITMKTWNDDQHLYLSITDTGLGMKKENLKKILISSTVFIQVMSTM